MKLAMLLASTSFAVAFNSGECATVTIETEAGPVRINKSDYDANPDGFKLFNASEPAKQSEPPVVPPLIVDDAITADMIDAATIVATATPAPATTEPTPPADPANAPTLAVMQDGKKHFVTDQTGERVKMDGIDAKGYANAQDAWNAILALPR